MPLSWRGLTTGSIKCPGGVSPHRSYSYSLHASLSLQLAVSHVSNDTIPHSLEYLVCKTFNWFLVSPKRMGGLQGHIWNPKLWGKTLANKWCVPRVGSPLNRPLYKFWTSGRILSRSVGCFQLFCFKNVILSFLFIILFHVCFMGLSDSIDWIFISFKNAFFFFLMNLNWNPQKWTIATELFSDPSEVGCVGMGRCAGRLFGNNVMWSLLFIFKEKKEFGLLWVDHGT